MKSSLPTRKQGETFSFKSRYSVGHKISCYFQTQSFITLNKRLVLNPILSQLNSAHILKTSFFKTRFNIIFHKCNS